MKKLIIFLAAMLLVQMTAYGAALNAECIFDGNNVVIKGKLETGNNDEFSIVITTPDGRNLAFQNTGNNDGSFEFKIAVPQDEVMGEYKITLDTDGADNPAVVYFTKNSGSAAESVFVDINEAQWAADAIKFMKENGYAQGDGDGYYRPNDNVSCKELIKLTLSAVAGEKHEESSENWSALWVSSANEKGLIEKIFADKDLDLPAERQQAAAMIYELLANKGESDSSGFTDGDLIAEYAKAAVDYLSASGIINGMPDGSFAPQDNLTRAEIAQMLYKLNK